MADETPPLDEARVAEARKRAEWQVAHGQIAGQYAADFVLGLISEIQQLRAKKAAAREMNVSERYRSALQEVLAAQEAYYDLHSAKPLWWDSSYAEALERGAEGEINSLE